MTSNVANVEMAAAWEEEGKDWAAKWEHHDRAIHRHHLRLLEAAAISPGETVLDVGCGNGQTTRDAARASVDGTALGVDLSASMLARARELARAEGLTNVQFEQADAQVHAFEADSFDVVLSRFGAMFFADPVAAFRNIGQAMRPGGRLVMVAWKELGANEWLQAIRGALAVGRDLPAPPAGAPGPFGLADPDGVRAMLNAAGFEHAQIESMEEPFWAGADADEAFRFVSDTGIARGLLGGLDQADRAGALDALRAAMVAHDTGSGVLFGSAANLISARRPAR